MRHRLFDLSQEDLTNILEGEPNFRSSQIIRALHERYELPWESSSLPLTLRTHLRNKLKTSVEDVEEKTTDADQTTKALMRFPDGSEVETVLMKYARRSTVCVSSQAGCAMGCVFCATGQMGFGRNLHAFEMEEQFVWAARRLRADGGAPRPSNIVLMGMGEPLANYNAVTGFIRKLINDYKVGARSITLSTVGVAPGIRRLSEEDLQINLAVSLHAANDTLRSELIPLNDRYPLPTLIESLKYYRSRSNRRISFEYAMMSQVNDSDEHAEELSEIALSLGAHVNLIPLNPTPGYPTVGSSLEVISHFQGLLIARGVNTTIRDTRGSDIAAACGQLAGESKTKLRLRRRSR